MCVLHRERERDYECVGEKKEKEEEEYNKANVIKR